MPVDLAGVGRRGKGETMPITMTFLGVGSGVTPELGNNNVLVEGADPHAALLIDCGYTTPTRLLEMERLTDVRHLVLTHIHADHAGGVEPLAVLCRYVYRHRPTLYVPEALWEELWHGTLRGGLAKTQTEAGEPTEVSLAEYLDIRLLKGDRPTVSLPGLPRVTFAPTEHVAGKACYSLFLGDRLYYSGDTKLLPPAVGPGGQALEAIFQDCQLFSARSNVHTPLEQLTRDMAPDLKAITYLMHYGRGFETIDPQQLGFRGFVRPMQPLRFAD